MGDWSVMWWYYLGGIWVFDYYGMDTGVGVVGRTGLLDSYHGVGGFSVLLGSRHRVAVGSPGGSELLDEL